MTNDSHVVTRSRFPTGQSAALSRIVWNWLIFNNFTLMCRCFRFRRRRASAVGRSEELFRQLYVQSHMHSASSGFFLHCPPLPPPVGSGGPEGGLRTPHVNLITWPRAVWDTWGYRIRPTAWRGARSTRELKGPVFPPPDPPSFPTPTTHPATLQPHPYLLWRAGTGAHFSASPR